MRDANHRLVSVILPVYHNADSLPELLVRLRNIADELHSNALDFEFVFIDDGSLDESFDIIEREAESDPRVRGLRLSRNFGSNIAILAGLSAASGDAMVVISADLQDPPEVVAELVNAWDDDVDVVLAARGKRDDPLLSRLGAVAFNRLFRAIAFKDFPPDGFDLMLVSRRVANLLVKMGERNSYIFGQVLWVGFRRRVIHYDRVARPYGRSRWTFGRKVKYFADAFTAFSSLPLRLSSAIGMCLALIGLVYAVVLLVTTTLVGTGSFSELSALTVVVLVASGVQLLMVGICGEYLWRVLEEARRRPAFIVASTVNLARPLPTDAQTRNWVTPADAGSLESSDI